MIAFSIKAQLKPSENLKALAWQVSEEEWEDVISKMNYENFRTREMQVRCFLGDLVVLYSLVLLEPSLISKTCLRIKCDIFKGDIDNKFRQK